MANVDEVVQMMKYMAEQVTKLVEVQAENQRNGSTKRVIWDAMDKYKNIKTFAGDSKEWDEFATKFRSQVGAGDRKVAEILDVVETEMSEAQMEEADWVHLADEECDEEKVKEITEKLHNVLLSLTTGEANAVVRRCRGRNGLLAWKRLCTTLNPRTLASGVKAISLVLNPGKIGSATKADTAIDAWEDKMAKLSTEYGEDISAKMKVAVLYAMLPKDLQERVLDKCAVNWDGAKEGDAAIIYGKVKEEVKNIAKSRREMITPKPMEVDKVQADWNWWNGDEEQKTEDQEEEEENEINFVGKGTKGKGKGKGACWTCGEAGHRAAECPRAGKGKGDGKGYGKGHGSWYGKGGQWTGYHKGDGKGGAGVWSTPMVKACFGCGSTAHLVRDCPNKATQHVQEVRGEMDEPEVLFIGNTVMVEESEPWRKVTRRGREHKERECEMPPGLEKRACKGFTVLAEDDDDEDEEEVCHIQAVDHTVGDVGTTAKAESKKGWASLGVGEIVVDSAADESCWPKDQGGAFETKPSRKNIILKTANGAEMGHYGEKEVTFKDRADGDVVGLKFQVTDVKKPLLAVRRLVEKGNVVSFGPEPSQNYIHNVQTGKKIMLEKKGGAFVIKAHFVKEIEAGFTRQVR